MENAPARHRPAGSHPARDPGLARNPGMKLGTALLTEPGRERRALVSPLPSDPGRVVDLHAVEAERLRKLGEGQAWALAEAGV